jgi:bifunctional NMN adenylyltransferase/nudix hydrolase
MTYKYDLAVFIGRFQPFHLGHQKIIEEALEVANKVAIIIGSSNGPRTLRNPFTFEERRAMIEDAFSFKDQNRLFFAPAEDFLYNDELWVKNIQTAVASIYEQSYGGWGPAAKVTLFGLKKDSTSYYLDLFPQWSSEGIHDLADPGIVPRDATSIRNCYFKNYEPGNGKHYWMKDNRGDWRQEFNVIPESTSNMLRIFAQSSDFKRLREESNMIRRYKQSWEQAPFPPTFVTVDAVVVQSGHVLLIERKAAPGEGLWALPGGFLNQNETIKDGIIRELKEETKIKVPVPVLLGSMEEPVVFDHPHRSMRGRTITHAGLIHLKRERTLPKVKGSDDAANAKWFPFADVKRSFMFEDHYDIFRNLTGKI